MLQKNQKSGCNSTLNFNSNTTSNISKITKSQDKFADTFLKLQEKNFRTLIIIFSSLNGITIFNLFFFKIIINKNKK